MPGRRKSSISCTVRVDLNEVLDVEILDTKMLSENNMIDGSGPCEKSDCLRSAEGSDQENLHPVTLEDQQSSEQDKDDKDVSQSDYEAQKKEPKGYECKCCPFWCQNLKDFKDHVDSSHPNVILNPLYHCAVCDFNTQKFELLTKHNKSLHPDENNFKFKRIKKNNQTILEQTIQVQGRPDPEKHSGSDATVFPPYLSSTVNSPEYIESLRGGGRVSDQKDPITALNINGTVIIPEPSVLQDLSHVSPVLQRPPNFNCQPKIAVPLNSTKYNPSLDHNLTLITSFNKFPYPTHAELSWLTAASKHSEEQIKVWFTTQRLKQGITWSPEEVEEARKKMFNGSIPAPSTSRVSTPSAAAFQQAPVERRFPTATPNSVSVIFAENVPAEVAVSSSHLLKRSLMTHCGPKSKRPVMAVAPSQGGPKDKGLMAPVPTVPSQKEHHPMAPPFTTGLKKLPAVVPLMPLSSPYTKGKLLPLSGNPKTKPVVSLPSIVFPESLTRPTIAPPPIFAPPFKSSLLLPRLCKERLPTPLPAANVTFPNSPPLVTPHTRRLPIIQSARTPAKTPTGMPGQEERSAEEEGGSRGAATLNPVDLLLVDSHQKSSLLTQFPLLERMKGKTPDQLKILEEHFLRKSFLSHSDMDNLALTTRLSHREIDGWFAERRALRDNLELALLNSMGTKRTEVGKGATLPLNGLRKQSFGAEDLKSGSLPPTRSFQNSCSAAVLKDHFAQTEGATPSEVWPGLARVGLARWFCDTRSTLHAELFNNGGLNGGPALPEKPASSSPRGCGKEGGAKVLEAELGRLMEQHANGLSVLQHGELQDSLATRCE
ncbi:zinc fingers and homeoboxes protein 2-like [Phycodurus eques]|uniref:zinc fingers and homeoboxes protein 2-like n=1 Tax=Phycodurus eques TaxID=693459 RepID=UPI002ACEC4B6|nr:zinc fingers and homeoboxes protein 2-like [Phycodurus eques]XP_061520367.1 zinc fingers and homeoboxes protein 2-like [Phycodurus eques]